MKPILRTIRFLASAVERFLIYRVFSLNDTPHRLALGVAIGIFVTWTPTIGFQMVLVVALSWLFGANKLVGVPFVWLSNPATLIPVYGPNYLIGCWVLGHSPDGWEKILNAILCKGDFYDRILEWYSVTSSIFWELWVGSLIVGLVLGVMSYFTMYRLIVVYRTHWKHRLDAIYHLHHAASRKLPHESGKDVSRDGGAEPAE